MVVVVVPALAHGEQREQGIVLAGIRSGVAPAAKNVRERINGEGTVPEDYRADAVAPYQQAPAAGQEHADCENNGRDYVVFVQPAQFGIFIEIADQIGLRLVVAIR